MAESDTVPGAGIVLEYKNPVSSGSETWNANTGWTNLGALVDVEPPRMVAAKIPTHHSESANSIKTTMPGWGEGEDVTVTTKFARARLTAVRGLWRQDKVFRVRYSDGTIVGWRGYVTEFGTPVDVENDVTIDVTVAVNGDVVQEVLAE